MYMGNYHSLCFVLGMLDGRLDLDHHKIATNEPLVDFMIGQSEDTELVKSANHREDNGASRGEDISP